VRRDGRSAQRVPSGRGRSGPGWPGGELRADRPRGRACGARAGTGWPKLAWSVGQLLPGDTELDHEPAGRCLFGRRPGGVRSSRRDRPIPAAVRVEFRCAGSRGSRRGQPRTRTRRRVPASHLGRRAAGGIGRCVHGSLSAALSPRGRDPVPTRRGGDRCSGLPQSRRASAGQGPGRGQRPDRLPALRGAARIGPRGVLGLRTGPVAAAAARRPRHRHLAQGDQLLRHPAQRPPVTSSSSGRQPARDRPARRP
jgi:hypothetical protein